MTRSQAFWDTSALVPLCVVQSSTAGARALYKSYEVVVWWTTQVEIASALARLLRMKQLDVHSWNNAHKARRALAEFWSTIGPSEALRGKAMELIDTYDLRAADALQLAAALEWCEGEPQDRVFLTTDEKLREAALLCGFDAKPL